jgi:hypothetical protein
MLDTYPRGRRPRGDVSSIKPTSEVYSITYLYRVSQKKGNYSSDMTTVSYHYSSDMTISNSTVVRLEGILNSQGPKIFCA